VLIDDLVTRGVTEPYRMFTSRAEYRLSLREDNADLRLTEIGRKLGLVDAARWESFQRKRSLVSAELERLKSTWVNPRLLAEADVKRLFGERNVRDTSLADLLKRPGVSYTDVAALAPGALDANEASAAQQVEVNTKYAGYIERQREEVERQVRYESLPLPATIDYREVRGLSKEVQQKLNENKPETLGQAGRISGVTPAAVGLLLVHLKRGLGAKQTSA
jgi:tRNA uridine 5-carboxymethylaminomethyl modification enzyme